MLSKIYKTSLIPASLILPVLAFADNFSETGELLSSAKDIITDIVIPLVFTLALLLFFWGVVKYIWGVGSGKDEGKKIMVWGIIALFVMSCVWAIVYFIGDELGLGGEYEVTVPNIKK